MTTHADPMTEPAAPAPHTPEPPHRVVRLALDLEADGYDDLRHALESIVWMLEAEPRPMGADVTSGGYASGYQLTITVDQEQTGDAYREQLREWATARRAERAATAAPAVEEPECSRCGGTGWLPPLAPGGRRYVSDRCQCVGGFGGSR